MTWTGCGFGVNGGEANKNALPCCSHESCSPPTHGEKGSWTERRIERL
jgi:hypothetical protein